MHPLFCPEDFYRLVQEYMGMEAGERVWAYMNQTEKETKQEYIKGDDPLWQCQLPL